PTATQYVTVTGADGRYQIPNVRVGGPYTVTATLSGFRVQKEENVNVALGEERSLEFKMPLATIAETVVVVGQATFNETRAGTADNVPAEAIQSLPTMQRGVLGFAGASLHFSVGPDGPGTDPIQ